ncbi:hypothetical protein B296_00000035 [Ensete ventricosum]|uniref:Uncharacterized protein n=1 Tax=Ensete ventricosum TaxID=4639 RepID=A0A427ALX2_ENSVE|nr:hypothetical protein B296_00000035 [Ensete ventricosum]
MTRISCFPALLIGKKKKSKVSESSKIIHLKKENGNGDMRLEPEEFVYASIEKARKEASFEDSVPVKTRVKEVPSTNVKLVREGNKDEDLVQTDVTIEAAYEGGDEHDDFLSMKRDFSDFDLQALAEEKGETTSHGLNQESSDGGLENVSGNVDDITPEVMIQSGHVSDPGMGRTTAFWGSPMLMRSCSNIETKRASKLFRSYDDDLQNLSGNFLGEAPKMIPRSPTSVITSWSADKVMLKKRSSSQVLPSTSRKLWWKLFLWSHRNLHKTRSLKPEKHVTLDDASNLKDGYCSDTLEPSCGADLKNKKAVDDSDIRCRNGAWPPNQWVAFSAESSSFDRVSAWVHNLDDSPFCPTEDHENEDGEAEAGSIFLETGESSRKNCTRNGRRAAEEVSQANNIIQSLNSLSSVAHIGSMGLKVIPAISVFTSLRSVNLSGNSIGNYVDEVGTHFSIVDVVHYMFHAVAVHISTGSLPKSLHMLDLSRNKIATIEGLRELTRLRVLNLSYNRISRVGHGRNSYLCNFVVGFACGVL